MLNVNHIGFERIESPVTSVTAQKSSAHRRLFFIFFLLGLNVALTHQNTKENVAAQKKKQRGGNDRKRTATTKIKHN